MATTTSELPPQLPPLLQKQPLITTTTTSISTPSTSTSPTPIETPTWLSIAARRKHEINSSIPPEWLLPPHLLDSKSSINLVRACGILTDREVQIVYSTTIELLQKMREAFYTAVEVTTAFCKSASIAHQATNCLAYTIFPQALSLAAELDAYLAKHGKPIGPLHGLPISVKEHIYMKDTPATSGFVAWADKYCMSEDGEGVAVRVLREMGAVYYVKTTNPQGLMAIETTSNLYGTTTNPLNRTLTPGGSSGGEGALIAMRGSPLGIGTDIGGSIRVPALSCGIYGLKPSVARLPHSGLSGAHDGMDSIIGVVGPLANSLADLELFCKVLLDAEPWKREISLLPLPWKGVSYAKEEEENRNEKLKIGIIYDNGEHIPHPPILRVLRSVEAKLVRAGHEVMRFPTYLHKDIVANTNKLYLLDGGAEYREICKEGNEQPTELLEWILSLDTTKERSVTEMWGLHRERNRLRDEEQKVWIESEVDCVICAPGTAVASCLGESRYWGYTSVWNGVDRGVVCLPVKGKEGLVLKGDEWENKDLGGRERERGKSEMEGMWGEGGEGAGKYQGARVGLQVVGGRLQEERLLEMARIIERVLGEGL